MPNYTFTERQEQAALALAEALRDPATMAAVLAATMATGQGDLAAELTAWREWAQTPAGRVTYGWAIQGLLERAQSLRTIAQTVVEGLAQAGQDQAGADFAAALDWALNPKATT